MNDVESAKQSLEELVKEEKQSSMTVGCFIHNNAKELREEDAKIAELRRAGKVPRALEYAVGFMYVGADPLPTFSDRAGNYFVAEKHYEDAGFPLNAELMRHFSDYYRIKADMRLYQEVIDEDRFHTLLKHKKYGQKAEEARRLSYNLTRKPASEFKQDLERAAEYFTELELPTFAEDVLRRAAKIGKNDRSK